MRCAVMPSYMKGLQIRISLILMRCCNARVLLVPLPEMAEDALPWELGLGGPLGIYGAGGSAAPPIRAAAGAGQRGRYQ